MKKILLVLTTVILISIFASCNNVKAQEQESKTEAETPTSTETAEDTETKVPEAPREDVDEMFGRYMRPNDDASPMAFTVTINTDGTYHYSESALSSHLGFGKYTIEGNVITLIDDNIPTSTGSKTYYFKFEYRDGKLIFLANESDQFMYVNLPEGAVFERVPQADN